MVEIKAFSQKLFLECLLTPTSLSRAQYFSHPRAKPHKATFLGALAGKKQHSLRIRDVGSRRPCGEQLGSCQQFQCTSCQVRGRNCHPFLSGHTARTGEKATAERRYLEEQETDFTDNDRRVHCHGPRSGPKAILCGHAGGVGRNTTPMQTVSHLYCSKVALSIPGLSSVC
ncbi:Hypothetical predicted protein [Podarcis lilfordi]|uniref:Uncharacterized protein n=1 Tax=Podarcis lilfordi TaxID=74358 RepID=A0AA35KVX7_9SAUR|nr:Hypothetical predicted protein [Podarcis lilfordi]